MIKKIVAIFILTSIIFSCGEKNKEENTLAPSPSPIEEKETYVNDQEEYEPTDSISQDSDGPVH